MDERSSYQFSIPKVLLLLLVLACTPFQEPSEQGLEGEFVRFYVVMEKIDLETFQIIGSYKANSICLGILAFYPYFLKNLAICPCFEII